MSRLHTVLILQIGLSMGLAHAGAQNRLERSEVCQVHLGKAEADALDAAVATGEYGFDLMTIKSNGRSQSVLLFGEGHLKSATAGAAGKSLVDLISAVATEGAPTKLWGSRLMNLWMNWEESRALKKGMELSTIDHANALYHSHLLKKVLALNLMQTGLSGEQVKALGVLTLENGETIASEELTRIMDEYQGRVSPSPSRKVFNVEEGHTVTLRENVGSLLVLAQLLLPTTACVASVCGLSYAALASPEHLAPAGVMAVLSLGSAAVAKWVIGDRIVGSFLGKPRDPTMAKNIATILRDHPEVDKLLVIVGLNHVAGVSALLKSRGFKSAAKSSPK